MVLRGDSEDDEPCCDDLPPEIPLVSRRRLAAHVKSVYPEAWRNRSRSLQEQGESSGLWDDESDDEDECEPGERLYDGPHGGFRRVEVSAEGNDVDDPRTGATV